MTEPGGGCEVATSTRPGGGAILCAMSHAHETASDQPPTYADIEALPPNVVGEILDGELHVSPRPALPHAEAATTLGVLLGARFQMRLGGPGGWRFLDEPELSLGVDPRYDPVVPDLAGWHIDVMPERLQTAQCHVAPQWVCEVLSPSTHRADRLLKLPFYGRAGVGHVWLVDVRNEAIEVYALRDGQMQLVDITSGDEAVRAEPFDAVPLELSWLWGRSPAEPEPEPPAESE